jgi:hypothetical protein
MRSGLPQDVDSIRDVIALLEERWLSPELAQREALVGPIEEWEAVGLIARRDVGKSDPAPVQSMIQKIVQETGGPLTEAIREIRVDGSSIVIEFRPPDPLVPKEVDGRVVECLLY